MKKKHLKRLLSPSELQFGEFPVSIFFLSSDEVIVNFLFLFSFLTVHIHKICLKITSQGGKKSLLIFKTKRKLVNRFE